MSRTKIVASILVMSGALVVFGPVGHSMATGTHASVVLAGGVQDTPWPPHAPTNP